MSTELDLSDWFATPQGQYVMAYEHAYFDRTVVDIFGFNALQIGLPRYDLLRNCRIPFLAKGGREEGVQLLLEPEELPVETHSIDLLVLPHVLEFGVHPHQILREAERVVLPEGNLIISGFNPYSLWGIRQKLSRSKAYPWQGKYISLHRLKDWLALMGFDVVEVQFACYAPPIDGLSWLCNAPSSKYMERWWSRAGGVYFLRAIKRVPGMRLLKPRWNGRLIRKFIPAQSKLNRESTPLRLHGNE